jgi:hypothetical protein
VLCKAGLGFDEWLCRLMFSLNDMIMVEIMVHYELYNNNNIAIFCDSLLNETIMIEIMARYQQYNNNILNNNAIFKKN